MRTLAILSGGLLLVWPALLNHYPILFSDTHAFLVQASQPRMVWDKPWIYGPFLLALHGRTTLWLPLSAQGLLLSHLLWLAAKALGVGSPLRHVLLCVALAAGSAAPWIAALLMPDLLAPVTVLSLFLLAFGTRLTRWERGWAGFLATFAIAAHLSHLVIAAACAAVALALGSRRVVALPLAGALALLALTNTVGFGVLGISPYGAVFALARQVADGPAREVIAQDCAAPAPPGWTMCGWVGRLPERSDDFLWNPHGPVWSRPGGPEGLAPEAGTILRRTLAEYPGAVTANALRATWRQLGHVALGDTLGPDWLEQSVAGSLRAYFPPEEQARYADSLQLRNGLRGFAAPLNRLHALLLALGAVGSVAVLVLRRGDACWRGFVALVLAGVLANAFATGALSGVWDRYQARIAWLVLLPPVFAAPPLFWRSGARDQIGVEASTSVGER
jgi:hypothetical protein